VLVYHNAKRGLPKGAGPGPGFPKGGWSPESKGSLRIITTFKTWSRRLLLFSMDHWEMPTGHDWRGLKKWREDGLRDHL